MKPNVGNVDRTIRIVVGLSLVAGALTGYIGAWGWLGLIPIASIKCSSTYSITPLSTVDPVGLFESMAASFPKRISLKYQCQTMAREFLLMPQNGSLNVSIGSIPLAPVNRVEPASALASSNTLSKPTVGRSN